MDLPLGQRRADSVRRWSCSTHASVEQDIWLHERNVLKRAAPTLILQHGTPFCYYVTVPEAECRVQYIKYRADPNMARVRLLA